MFSANRNNRRFCGVIRQSSAIFSGMNVFIKQEEVMDALKLVNSDQLKKEVPQFEVGDTVKVSVKIKEGERERIQLFEGTVLAKKHGGIEETFTVRRVSYGVGVERVFPLHSPIVEKVEVVRRGRVRRSKIYYIRDRVGKASKVKDQIN
jgi:large subunit ribosomal protein L19